MQYEKLNYKNISSCITQFMNFIEIKWQILFYLVDSNNEILFD